MELSRYVAENRTRSTSPANQPPLQQPASNQKGNVSISGSAVVHWGDIYNQSETNRCLRDLCSTSPAHHKKRIENKNGGLLQDAYSWILDHDSFKQWRHGGNRLLWVNGDPGKGKTMLLCGIIDELTPTTKMAKEMGKREEAKLLLSYFFCQATDPRLNHATAVLRGLIYMLVKQQPALLSHVQRDHDSFGKTLDENADAWEVLSEIFTNILADPTLQGGYIVVDALDECTDRGQLLELIASQSAVFTHVTWVVASRNFPDIDEQLYNATHKATLCLELNAESISAAVGKYIKYKVDQLALRKKYSSSTRNAVQHYLSSNATDTFLWVALVCQNLENVPRNWNVREKLIEFPPSLDLLYQRMIEGIYLLDDAALYIRILAIVSTVYRPITLDELACLAEGVEFQLDGSASDEDDNSSAEDGILTDIIHRCGSFLTLRDRTIYFIHQSAKEFLVTKSSARIFPLGMGATHHNILSQSLNALSNILRKNIYKLENPGCPIGRVRPPKPDPLARVRYSCVYWIDHLADSCHAQNSSNLQDGGLVHRFLCHGYLHWLEALSLLKKMSEGTRAIDKLDRLLQVGTNWLYTDEPKLIFF